MIFTVSAGTNEEKGAGEYAKDDCTLTLKITRKVESFHSKNFKIYTIHNQIENCPKRKKLNELLFFQIENSNR